MDSSDVEILKLLQKNARITVSEISSKINISISAVSERVKKLEASGIIQQYTAITSARLLKKNLTAIMFVSLERPKYTERFVEFVNGEDEILECHYLAGDYDYALKILTEGTDTLEKLLNRIKSVQGIQKTKTIVTLSTIKNNYSVTPEITTL
ncbi:MAG: Lrp/AsnC family transcriptional regulator [Clostridiales bacterium]|nr:Lrp/AsnC family transcriptional regulator [Clostridiales bacterium]